MYNSKLLKRYTAPHQAPTPDEVDAGELIINSTSGELYTKTTQDGKVHLIGTPDIEQFAEATDLNLTAFQNLALHKGALIACNGSNWLSLTASTHNNDVLITDSSTLVGVRWGAFSIINPTAPNRPVLTVNGDVNQTANLLDCRAADGSLLTSIAATGQIATGGAAYNTCLFTAIGTAETAYYARLVHTVTQLGDAADRSLFHGVCTPTINSGYTAAGGDYGIDITITRQQADAGTLNTLAGARLAYGNNHGSATTSTINHAYGIWLQPYDAYGTILQQYDLYIAAPIGDVPGTISSHYGIYQADNTADNYLAGGLNLGTVGNGSSTLHITQTDSVGCTITARPTATSSGSNTSLNLNLAELVPTGIINLGAITGIITSTLVTGTSGGALHELTAHNATYGSDATTPHTIVNVYGLKLQPTCTNAHINNLYDLYIETATGDDNVSNHWGIYQKAADARNLLTGTTSIGGTTTASALLYLDGGATTDTAILIDHTNTVTTNIPRYFTGIHANLDIHIGSGASDNGTSTGLNVITQTSGAGSGSLLQLFGMTNRYGHNMNAGTTGSINACYGMYLQPVINGGSITSLYDFYIAEVSGAGTTGMHYGIYQADYTCQNALNGQLQIGSPASIDCQLSINSVEHRYGGRLDHQQITHGTRDNNQTGLHIHFTQAISAGYEYGSSNGLVVDAFRMNSTVSGPEGQGSITGARINYGALAPASLARVYGLVLSPTLYNYGIGGGTTVPNFCSLYIGANTGTGDAPGGYFGIYQAEVIARNVLMGTVYARGGLEADAVGALQVPVVIKGFTSQLADLQQWQNSSGTPLASIDCTGVFTAAGLSINSLVGSSSNNIIGGTWDLDNGGGIITISDATAVLLTIGKGSVNPQFLLGTATASLAVKGASSQSADLMQWYTSGGGLLAKVTPTGKVGVGPGGLTLTRTSRSVLAEDAAVAVGADGLVSFVPGIVAPVIGGANTNIGDWANMVGTNFQVGIRSATNRAGLAVQASNIQTTSLQEWQNSAGDPLLRVDSVGRLISTAAAPGVLAGTGAGTGGAASLVGTDMCGVVTVATGSGPSVSATVATVTFGSAYDVIPKLVQLVPAGATAGALSGAGQVYAESVNISRTRFTLNVGSTALAPGTTYRWYYLVIG